MTKIPKDHPRYVSLMIRERLVSGFKDGLVAPEGMLAHGRGEAFDYLIGERTNDFALKAIDAAAAMLLLGKAPVVSVNGNAAALCPSDMVAAAEAAHAKLEVNLFYRTEERVGKIVGTLEAAGAKKGSVLGRDPDARIPGLDGPRGQCSSKGMYIADVVLVPLEDGDRTQALKKAGKKVVTIDLNPMSRTALAADITIVDNIVRAMPLLAKRLVELRGRSRKDLDGILAGYDNGAIMAEAMDFMTQRLTGGLGGPK